MSERRGARRRSRDLFVASPSVADIAAAELEASAGPAPGLLWCSGPRDEPVFARQVLADAAELSGSSPDELSLAVFQWLDASTAEAMLRGEVIVHVSWPEFGEGRERRHAPYMAEAATISDAIEARRAGRARKKDVVRSNGPATSLLQVLVTERWRAYVSCGTAPASDPLLAWPSLFPAGRAPVRDRPAPSSAFRKLVEAFAWLGTQPNEDDRVLDLGAAPGGSGDVPAYEEARFVIRAGNGGPVVRGCDSVSLVKPEDEGAVVVTASHGEVLAGSPTWGNRPQGAGRRLQRRRV